jgi:hypothetical protein
VRSPCISEVGKDRLVTSTPSSLLAGNDGKPYQFRSHDEGVLNQLPPAVLEQLAVALLSAAYWRPWSGMLPAVPALRTSKRWSEKRICALSLSIRTVTSSMLQHVQSFSRSGAARSFFRGMCSGSPLPPLILESTTTRKGTGVGYHQRPG